MLHAAKTLRKTKETFQVFAFSDIAAKFTNND